MHMKLGFCGNVDLASSIKDWGYDYVELALASLAQLTDDEFAAAQHKLETSGLPCLACNVFLPRSVPVVGPSVDRAACSAYARTAMTRAAAVGAQVVVFGSSGSRNIPGGFSGSRALEQIRDFALLAAEEAAKNNITVVMEPLNGTESNIINRVSEALIMALAVNHPNFKVLGDTYHMDIERESLSAFQLAGPELRHVHVSTFLGRKIPLETDRQQLAMLINILKSIDYQGNISIEAGHRSDQAAEAREALEVLRSLL
jgi:sugar phosphate isomerase/epimerase